ncbi:hypothetical protein ACJIZ3_004549 [Penstemon smallii]|uniref:Protein kinase domain-containing protein n=1 Tax=Penstemon smallii TaxID=265156 RepID=A0ABD3S2D2_9LAMI
MDNVESSFIFITFLLLSSITNAETIKVRDALVQFMSKLSPLHDQNESNWGWNKTSDPCKDNWKGITCHNNSPTIKKIVLEELNLTGQLDAISLCTAKSLTVLSLNSNNIMGTISEDISKCSKLTHIYLHTNNFSGNLPNSLSKLSNLKRLDVSKNRFSGAIPDMSRISGLLTFLAENNNFNGGIPNFDFSNLETFNVSNNNLSGPAPDFGGRFNETSLLNNPGLCGNLLSNSCPLSTPSAKNRDSFNKNYFIYSGYAAIGFIILCLLAFLLIQKGKSKQKNNDPKEEFKKEASISTTSSETKKRSEFSITSAESAKGSPSSSLVVLSSAVVNGLRFEDLLRSPAELIGRGKNGSLYKVMMMKEKLNVAVKRIRDWEITGDGFKKRMQRIDEVKHVNVMNIVAFYCSKQEKLLVYEFQENGSLFKLLHGSQNGQSLEWESRLNVAAKISAALSFMHENLQADGIAHGNLKSSNILFSKQMDPCLSEYGLAEVENDQDRSFLDQKNAFKSDVYSFGLILLELLTGKLVQNNGFDIANWVNSAIREEWTVEVFDKGLVSEGANEEQMVNLLHVALKCINSSPEARPNMREIVGMINSIKDYEVKSSNSDP